MIDWDLPLETDKGYPVRVLADDLLGPLPFCVAINNGCAEDIRRIARDGTAKGILVRNKAVKFERTFYVNIYADGRSSGAYKSSADAAYYADHGARIGCIRVKVSGVKGQFDA